VNSAFPPICLRSTALSVSALVMSSFRTAPFPLAGGEMWMSCFIVCRPAPRSDSYSEQSGCSLSSSECFPSNEAMICTNRSEGPHLYTHSAPH
jgi:hypothetical protein